MTPDHSEKSVRQKRRQSAPKQPGPPVATPARRQIPEFVPALAYLFFAFGFAWLWVNPALHYQARTPLFYWDGAFLSEMLARPGGLLRFLCNFLEHFYRTPWAGALLMTVVLGGVWIGAQALVRPLRSKVSVPLAAGVLLALEPRYEFPWLETALGLLLAAGAARLYLTVPLRGKLSRVVFFSTLSLALNLVAGPVPAALFIVLTAAGEWFASRPAGLCAAILVTGLVVEIAVAQLYRASHLLLPWKATTDQVSIAVFYASFLFPYLYLGHSRAKNSIPVLAWRGLPWAIVAASIAMAFALSNTTRKGTLEVDYYAERQQWSEVLRVVPHLKEINEPTRVHINRALYHEGGMLESLFQYWHRVDQPLLPGPETGLDVCRATSATLLELGQVNLAEHLAHEAFEVEGDKPCILQMLFKINIVKGRPQTARTFLGFLRKNPFYRSWADNYLARMEEDPTLSQDPDFASLRALRIETDNPGELLSSEAILLQCLGTNPKNRMAFEYLIAHYLLTMNTDGIVNNLSRLNDLGMPALPSLLQEAILAHRQLAFQNTGQTPAINLYGRTIDPPASQRFQRFGEIVVGAYGDTTKYRPTLAREMGSSYFYYSVYTETAFKPGAKFSSL